MPPSMVKTWPVAQRASSLASQAAMAATSRGESLERRLLHLTPVLFVSALLARQAAGGTPPIPTDLLPILPAACLLGGALFSYAGLDLLQQLRRNFGRLHRAVRTDQLQQAGVQ